MYTMALLQTTATSLRYTPAILPSLVPGARIATVALALRFIRVPDERDAVADREDSQDSPRQLSSKDASVNAVCKQAADDGRREGPAGLRDAECHAVRATDGKRRGRYIVDRHLQYGYIRTEYVSSG